MSTSSITGKLLKSLMEKHQLECGSKTNFFELNPNSWSKLLTKTWLSTTWQDMWTYKTNLQLDNNILPAVEGNDVYIMDLYFQKIYPIKVKQLLLFNWCRLYTRSLRLYQLCKANGTFIEDTI